MKRKLINNRILIIISSLIVTIDQLSKKWAVENLIPSISSNFIPGILRFRIVKNTGAAFSLFSDSVVILGFLSLLVSIILFIFLLQSSKFSLWKGLSLAFLLGGSLGNGLDRWRLGYVTDFLELVPIDFPIFNIADISINFAIICFLINLIGKRNEASYT